LLLGHIDGISTEKIGGWVFDTENPGRRITVSIYVDGRKFADVACDRERPDLQQAGRYGDGRHGFLYRFDPPLSTQVERTITVRHALDGTQVANGRCVLTATGVRYLAGPAPERPEQSMRIRGPENPRQLFEILALYEPKHELYDLLAQVDFSLRNEREAHFCVFGAYPRDDTTRSSGVSSIPDTVNAMMLSDEFQREIISIFLNAYHEKKRLLFVHIPKCAGSDLSNHLTMKYPSIGQRISDAAWTTRQELFACLRDIVLRLHFADSIFVRDHISLEYYIGRGLIRPGDAVFTVVRNPLQIPLSQVNYILTRLSRNSHRAKIDPDTRSWLEVLGVDTIPEEPGGRAWRELAIRILRDRSLVPPNPMCHWLGGGTAEETIGRLETYSVEVTDTERYTAWLSERWGIDSSTRANASDTFLSLDSLGPRERSYMTELSQEDTKLYNIIRDCLSRSERPSETFGKPAAPGPGEGSRA
jgi:hypothetical protein